MNSKGVETQNLGDLQRAQDLVSTPAPNVFRATRKALADARATFRQSGFRGVLARYGWKVLAAFFVYYLVRDVILYILIPYAIAQKFWS